MTTEELKMKIELFEEKKDRAVLKELLDAYNSNSRTKYKESEVYGCSSCRETILNALKKAVGLPYGRWIADRKTKQERFAICSGCPELTNGIIRSCGTFGMAKFEFYTGGKKSKKTFKEVLFIEAEKYRKQNLKQLTCGCSITLKIQGINEKCPQQKW
jgi:hypothetical protein